MKKKKSEEEEEEEEKRLADWLRLLVLNAKECIFIVPTQHLWIVSGSSFRSLSPLFSLSPFISLVAHSPSYFLHFQLLGFFLLIAVLGQALQLSYCHLYSRVYMCERDGEEGERIREKGRRKEEERRGKKKEDNLTTYVFQFSLPFLSFSLLSPIHSLILP